MIFRVNIKNRIPEKVLFVDRDGTLIEDDGYLSDPAMIKEIGSARRSLAVFRERGWGIFLVSNQAGVAKGVISIDSFHAVRRQFEKMFDPRGDIFDGIMYCPHHVEGVVSPLRVKCRCRKPETGMVDFALSLFDSHVAPENTYVVGDKYSDILLGKRKGVKTVLVLTGYGKREKEIIDDPMGLPDIVAIDFDEAAKIIVERD